MSYCFEDIRPEAHSSERVISLFFFPIILFLLSAEQLGHVSPPTGKVQSWKFWHHIKDRDKRKRIFDFGGKIPTRWFPMRENNFPIINIGDVAPHIFCGRFPWKTEIAWAGGSKHGIIVGFTHSIIMQFSSYCKLHYPARYSLSLSTSLSLSISLSLFSHYKYRPHSINSTCQCEDWQCS